MVATTPHRPKKLIVPDVTGLNREDAAIVLRNAGFQSPKIHMTEDYAPPDTVVRQYPIKGQLVPSETEVVFYVSRKSFLDYLPSAYRATGPGTDSDFLRNFLWIFQHITDSLNRTIDRVHRQFSPFSADESFLPWLAQWVGVSLDQDWPVEKKRAMVRAAAEL